MVGLELLEGLDARGEAFCRLPHRLFRQLTRGLLLIFDLLSTAACGGWVLLRIRIRIVAHKGANRLAAILHVPAGEAIVLKGPSGHFTCKSAQRHSQAKVLARETGSRIRWRAPLGP
jgi:hypothetical protein